MVDKEVISKKISLINHSLQRIEKYKGISLEEYLKNEDIQDITTHNLFIILQYIIGIGTHIIADDGLGEISYLSDIPEILAREEVISKELINPLKSMMGFRNILAHQYGDLDLKVVYDITQVRLKDIYSFLQNIIEYCRL